jgi:hypothetical protein
VLKSFAMRCATSKKITRPTSPSISRTERAKSKPKVVTIRALKPDDFTAEQFDRLASEHGARALTAAEKRIFRRLAAKREK